MSDFEPLLLLASKSAGRKRLLENAGITFTQMDAEVDEEAVLSQALTQQPELSAAEQVLLLAKAKAEAATAKSEGGYVVLGTDSMLEFEQQLVGKPQDQADALKRWQAMRAKVAVLHTGHWLIDDRDPEVGGTLGAIGRTASVKVHFANVSDLEIEAYLATGEPLRVAGAFTIDGYGGPFIEKIEGDPHAVVGLSLPVLRQMLQEFNLSITDLWSIENLAA